MKSLKRLVIVLIFSMINILAFGQKYSWSSDFLNQKVFIENKGQFDGRNWQKNSEIEYVIDHNGFTAFFTNNGLTYRFDKFIKNPRNNESSQLESKRINISELINISWLNSNENVKVTANDESNSYYSYAIKNRLTKEVYNINHIKGFNKLIYNNIYNNVDVEYDAQFEKGLKYTLFVHPGADLSKIKMKYSNAHTNIQSEFINYSIDLEGNLKIKSSLGEITELKPYAYYKDNQQEVKIKFKFENNILSFNVSNYDNTRELVIDPWIVSPTFNASTAAWEVETDSLGNSYVIGGETPMKLVKYNNLGVQQWAYSTPWDTASVWLGTLATDNTGTSYITSGTAPEMERVDNGGNMIWHTNGSTDKEWWSIAINCDKSKLIVGGTILNMYSFIAYATIFNIDINNGNELSSQNIDTASLSGFGAFPIEVRSITTSKNSEYIYLTHNNVGTYNQNISSCPDTTQGFKLDNGNHLSYKNENYLPILQNGGGLKAIIANNQFFYIHTGAKIYKRALSDGSLIDSIAIPGGVNQTFQGKITVNNCGLAVDSCGNVYAGSFDRVVKFDTDLNILSEVNVGFTVYDVSVNSNGEVVAVGAQFNNSSSNRNGKIQSINMNACPQYSSICCDAKICNAGPFCSKDTSTNLVPSTAGGTWTGTGITNSSAGTFNPSVAGAGIHTIFYTLPCGTDSVLITVNSVDNYTISSIGATATVTNLTGANYQWIDCDNGNSIIAGETDTSYTATVNGNYGVIINQNGCTSISTCVFIDVTNIEQNKNNYGIKIFPNPTNGILNIKFENEANNVNIEIENIIGQEIYKTNSNQVKGNMLSIDLGKYKNGFYIIKINNNNLNLKYKVLYEKNATN